MGYIYQIKNKINGKLYIGQTAQEDVKMRWKSHINAIKSNKGCPLLRIAINKYGLENFEFKVIIICFDEDLYSYEKEYIKRYNTFGKDGYNASAGGEPGGTFAGHTHTKENRELFSKINIEYQNRPEVREYRRNLMLKRFSDPEERQKHGKIMRKVNQRQKENGTVYTITKEHREKISMALKLHYNLPKTNLIDWNIDRKAKHSEIMSRINGKQINQYDLSGTLIASFTTIKVAAETLCLNRKAINAAVVGRTKTSGGFIWKYAT